ncbi:UNVERIFIED_CONTAM: AAA family ATPase, partial [Kocuria sp. CPCC 205274]
MTDQMFVQRGRNIFNASDRGDEIPRIPTGTYTVQFNPMAGGFYLQRCEDMLLPEKVYGSTLPRADMILHTFSTRKNKTTGALLTGLKGSGKTLLSKAVCAKALTMDVPVLILQQAFGGPAFEDWLNTIDQPVVIFIDEFEKKYDDEEKQNQLLSILDGVGRGSKLWLATSNSADVS